jgi:hypothetical protein
MGRIAFFRGKIFGHRHSGSATFVRFVPLVSLLLLICPLCRGAKNESGAPEVTSVFPLGGLRGSTYTAEIRGRNLTEAYAVWFDCDDLRAKLKGIETVKPEAKDLKGDEDKPRQLLRVEVVIRPGAKLGAHFLRVVTPAGISGPLAVRIGPEAAVSEVQTPHNTPATAQTLHVPGLVDGKISGPGELDFYRINAERDQTLLFEVLTSGGLYPGASGEFRSPRVGLYEASGSWFDPNRLDQLVPDDKSQFTGSNQYLPRLIYHFDKAMSLLVVVSAFEQPGGPDYGYQLRIAPAQPSRGLDEWMPRFLAHEMPNNFEERDFTRKLDAGWIQKISSRTVGATPPSKLSIVDEHEPNDKPEEASEFTVPALIEGAIGQPADTDYYKFQVKEKETLVFEIETPRLTQPYFNPRLAVLDKDGQELWANLYRRVGGCSNDWSKTLEPKTVYTFEHPGTYYIRMSDLANHAGNSDYRYRILVRPEIPHMGDVVPEGIGSVVAGEAKKWDVIAESEEGFEGELAVSVENLPPGVHAFAATAPGRDMQSDLRGAIHKDYYRPQPVRTTLLLVASADAPATRLPTMIRVVVTPVVNGKPGAPQTVDEYPLMVLRPTLADSPKQLRERADANVKQK